MSFEYVNVGWIQSFDISVNIFYFAYPLWTDREKRS